MSFSFQNGNNPAIDYPRVLVKDIVDAGHVFEDEEIVIVTRIEQLQWQSAQRYNGAAGAYLPSIPVSYRRIAATLLDGLACNYARISASMQLLDAKIDIGKATGFLRDNADALRKIDDESATFVIIEQVNTSFAHTDAFWKNVQRAVPS